jgi:MFS family permease
MKLIYLRLAVAVFFFICGLEFSSWASRIPAIKDEFHFNEAELGAVLFMLPLGSVIALPFAGWSVHRFGSRYITFISAIVYSILLYGIALCKTPFALSVLLFFFGFCGDTLNIAINTQGLDVQNLYGKPMLSSFHAMWSLGAMAGAVTGGWTQQHSFSTIQHFLFIALFSITFAVIMFNNLVKKDSASTEGQKIFAWPDKALMLLGIICFCCAMCEGAMADWSSLYYRQVIRDTGRVSTTGYTAFTLTMAFGRLVGDKIILLLGNRKTLVLDGIVIACGLALALSWQQPLAVIAGFGLVGLGVATIIPIVYSMAGKSKSMPAGIALAAVSTIGFSGFLVGPPVIGFVAHEIGLRFALLIVLILGVIIFFLSRRLAS